MVKPSENFLKSWIEKIMANLASVKVWMIFIAVMALWAMKIEGGEFAQIFIALIAAREIWKVAKIRREKSGE